MDAVIRRRPAFSGWAQTGFTLIELLVVVLIVGIALGSLSLGVGALERRDGEREFRRLQLLLERMAERAEVRGTPLAIEFSGDAYRVYRYDTDGSWRMLAEPPLFVERQLPDRLRWQGLWLDGIAQPMPWRLVFGSRAPRFVLELNVEGRIRRLEGRESGAVLARAPDVPEVGPNR